MNDDQYKGDETARFPCYLGRGVSDKTSVFFPYLFFLIIPVTFLLINYSPKSPPELDIWVEIVVLVLSFLLCLPFFFVFEALEKMLNNPIIIYSGGIYLKGGFLDHWTHRPDFIPRKMIEEVRVTEHVSNGSGRKQRFLTILVICQTNGKNKEIFRQEEQLRGFKDALEKADVMQYEKAYKIPVGHQEYPAAPTRSPWSDGPDRCKGCGAVLSSGTAFCGNCGMKI